MQELLGKISQTILIIGSFSFIVAMVSLCVAGIAEGFLEDLVNFLFFCLRHPLSSLIGSPPYCGDRLYLDLKYEDLRDLRYSLRA